MFVTIMVTIMVKELQTLAMVMDIREYIMFVTIMVTIMVKELQTLVMVMDIREYIMFVTIMVTIMVKDPLSQVMDTKEYIMCIIITVFTMARVVFEDNCKHAFRVQSSVSLKLVIKLSQSHKRIHHVHHHH